MHFGHISKRTFIFIFSERGKAKELSRVGFNIEEWRERRDQACPECEATPYQKMDGFWYVGTIRTGTVTHARGKTLRETLEQIGLGLRFVGLYSEAI